MVDASAVALAAKSIAFALAQEGKYLYGVEEHVRGLQRELKYMHQLLQDVDANPYLTRQDHQLHNFIQDLRELAFRAEDAIDNYIVDVSGKIVKKNPLVKLACLASHSYPVHMLVKEIEAIQQEIQNAKERFEKYGKIMPTTSQQLGNNNGSSSSQSRPNPEDYLHLDDEVVVGIDDDITHLVKRLIDPKDDFKVVGIVGTGGAGKTTLSTKLFRHNEVASWFPNKAFVSVSQQWSRIDILRRIFQQLDGGSGFHSSETELVKQLHDFIRDKQCLVVLDDIWRKEAWDDIYPIFSPANKGWRVILTTRIEEVPLYADNKCIIHKPQLLTEDQGWALFSKVALEGRAHVEKNPNFEILGRKMLRKCRGLPLAVVTLAGILRTKQELYQWEDISNAYAEYILKGKGIHNYGVVEDMLELSYFDLPTYLKPCFLYLAIFPEDWVIDARMLIWMWIVEGLITNDMIKGVVLVPLEEAAMRSLNELAQRCILHVTSRNAQGEINSFRMHDLMRELCIEKAQEYQFLGVVSSVNLDVRGARQPRRIANFSREYFPAENRHLRTLVYSVTFENPPEGVIRNLESIHEKFKLLRVLHIDGPKKVGVAKQIGNLIHLRYLGIVLRVDDINELPNSIRNLRNLLYLYLYFEFPYSGNKVGVPKDLVANMENLRALVLPSFQKRGFRFNRLGLSGSNNLQQLESGAGTWMATELPTLSITVQHLSIFDIQKEEEVEAIYRCPGIMEDRICTLACWFSGRTDKSLEFDLQKLRHCTALWSLYLACPLASNCTRNIQFPPNLVHLILRSNRIEQGVDLMQALAQLSKLRSLTLSNNAYLGKLLSFPAGAAFPQLRELYLVNLRNFKEWRIEEGAMPSLAKITITDCRLVKRLPQSIRSISTLGELVATCMSIEFCKRLGYQGSTSVGGEDSYIIQHIPCVRVSTTAY